MANNILKLTVEDSEYNAKLANAAKGIRHLADVAHQSNGDLTGLEKSELDYIRALGEMETKSRSASGQVRELTSTYKELKVIYDQLNEVEKADEGGKALAASLETLKQRAQEAKAQLDTATQSLNDNGEAGKGTSSVMDMLKDRFTVNIDAIKLFNMGLQAAEGVLNVVKDAFFSSEENLDDWGRTVEVSHSLYDGFLYALNTGDIGGFLNNIDQIVQAAQNAYDALDELGTFNAFNQINVQRTRTDMTESIADYRSGNGSKDTVKAAGEAYKKELQERKRLEKDAYLAAVERVAAERGVSAKDLTDALSGTYGHYQDLKKVNPTGERTVYYGGGMFGGGGSYIEKYAQNPQERLGQALRHLTDTELESLQALGAQAERTGDEIAQVDKQLVRVLNGKQPGGGTTTRTGTKSTSRASVDVTESLTELQLLQDELKTVENSMKPFGKATDDWKEMNTYAEELRQRIKEINGETPQLVKGLSINNNTGLSQYIGMLREQLQNADLGSELYTALSDQLADTTTLQNLVGEALKVGLGTALFDVADETGADFWTRAMEGGVANIDWQAIIDQINEARKAAGLDAISLDFKTGAVSTSTGKKNPYLNRNEEGKMELKMTDALGGMASGIQNMAGGLEQLGIDIPQGLTDVVSGIQSVTNILSGIMSIVSVIQAIAGADAIIPFAGGGIVPHFAGGGLIGNAALGMTIPGHSYSGDLLRLPVDGGRGMIGVNSGEIIMNQAQAGILESELSGGRMRDINVHGVLQGENIVLAVSNYFRRTGKGEAAMWGKN